MPGRSPPGAWRRRAAWLLVVALLLGTAVTAAWLGQRNVLDRPGPLPETRAVVVPHGSVSQVAALLRQAEVIADEPVFRIAVWLTGGRGALHAAELAFPAHGSLRQVLSVLRTAPPIVHRLTIPEGITARQIAALLNRAEAATGVVDAPIEGGVLPQTYDYTYGTPRAAILARASAAMDQALAAAWADRDPGVPLADPRAALTLASIVERETARPDERRHVAAVYLNRIRRGMRLEADPTTAYAVSHGTGALDHPLTRADLDSNDPFNTYRHAGLPPGPICSPGLATIQAVLHPAAGDDLYFVADGTGGHAFSRTLENHERNVAHWRALTATRGQAD